MPLHPFRSAFFFLLLCLLLGVSWYGYRGFSAWKRRQELSKPWTHHFREPDLTRPKAPPLSLFGLTLGKSLFSEAQATTQRLGLTCDDRSIRAMMKRQREERIATLQASGQTDGISGATWKRPSPRERNPTIRWNCEKVPASLFPTQGTSFRPASLYGRLLFVFDSPRHPLRHLSYQYDARPPQALQAYLTAIAYYESLLGKPSLLNDDRPLPALTSLSFHPTAPSSAASRSAAPASRSAASTSLPSPSTPPRLADLRKYDRFVREWNFGDARVRLLLRSYGTWFNLSEILEVPWPIRPDAPALKPPSPPPSKR